MNIDWDGAPEWATHWHPEFKFVQFNGEHWEDSQSTVLLGKEDLISRGRPSVPPPPPVKPVA